MSVAIPVVDTWDGENRRIILKTGVTSFHWIDDIYLEYRNERRTNESFRKWFPLIAASGNVSKGQGKATPRLLTLLTDDRVITTKVVPFDEATTISVNGEAITDIADTDAELFDMTTITNPVIIQYQPPSAEVIVVDAIEKSLDYAGTIIYDPTSIYSGVIHPKGTTAQPVNEEADVLALATLYNIKRIEIRNGTFVCPSAMTGYNFVGGTGIAVVDANGQDLSSSRFSAITLDGDFANTQSDIELLRCEFTNTVTNWSGRGFDCGLPLTISFKTGVVEMVRGYSLVGGSNRPSVDFNGGNIQGFFRGYYGGARILNASNALTKFSWDGDSYDLEFTNTVTAGEFVVRGIGELLDENGDHIPTGAWNGATVTNKTHNTADVVSGVRNMVMP